MKDGYRGDRRASPQLICGLVALTNYYIDQLPLGEGDELHDPRRFSVPRPKTPNQEDSDTADDTSESSAKLPSPALAPSPTTSSATKATPSQKKMRNRVTEWYLTYVL